MLFLWQFQQTFKTVLILGHFFSNFGSFFIHMALGKTALELANDPQMIQILNVKSVRKVRKTVNRLEGPLLRRSRFLGWRPVWVCF